MLCFVVFYTDVSLVIKASVRDAVEGAVTPPVDAGAGDAECDAQVDAGPPRLRLPTVTAVLVPSD